MTHNKKRWDEEQANKKEYEMKKISKIANENHM